MDENAEGSVTRHVYAQFIRAGGIPLFVASILLLVITEVSWNIEHCHPL